MTELQRKIGIFSVDVDSPGNKMRSDQMEWKFKCYCHGAFILSM